MINKNIDKLIEKQNLNYTETKESFDEIISGLATTITASSFVTGLKSKGATTEELHACVASAREYIKKLNLPINKENLIENINLSTTNKYFDFSVTNDILCATCDLNAVDYSFNSLLYNSNKFEILKCLGFNIDKENNDLSQFENVSLIYNYLSSKEPYYKYTNEITLNLKFDSILNITNKLLSPYSAKNIYLGITSKEDIEKYANILLNLNYSNSVILCSEENLPFISPTNKTYIAEAWKNKIFTYVATPNILGFKEFELDNYKVDNASHCAQIIKDILENKYKGPIYDGVIMNTALSLYISKRTNSLMDGIDLAKEIIDTSRALEKFNSLLEFYK